MEQPVSFVLRVINSGQNQPMHGQIEYIPTGEMAHFSSLEQAEAFIRRHMLPEAHSIQIPSITPGAQPKIRSIFSFMRGRQALPEGKPPLLPPVGELPVIEVVAPIIPEALTIIHLVFM